MVSALSCEESANQEDNKMASQVYIQNELLCFVISKLQVTPFEAIVKSCMEFYSQQAIQEAKDLLWNETITAAFPSRKDLRNIKRKGTSVGAKEKADLEDILKALQVCDREDVSVPQFCAVDLGNIPPTLGEEAGMTLILSRLSKMQSEISRLSETVQSLQNISSKPVSTWAQVVQGHSTVHSAQQGSSSSLGHQDQQKRGDLSQRTQPQHESG